MTNQSLRAAIYCRISQDQTGEQLGVARQREDCERLVESMGWVVSEVYVDNDISASSGKARPRYQAMLAAIQARQVDAVVAWAPDRLYRKLQDLEPLIKVMEANDTILKTVRGGEFDMGTPLGRMIARILASVATGEGEVKSDRWKRSVRQRREAGAMPSSGPRMKGWKRNGDLIPEEADEIRWMAERVLSGSSMKQLARDVRDRHIRSTVASIACPSCGGRLDVRDTTCPKQACGTALPPLEGNIMPEQSLRRLLLNPRLAGYSKLNGEIVGTGDWEPILDAETWEAVRSLLTINPGRSPAPRVATLAGLIWCGGCGAKMVSGSRTTKKKGVLSRTYRCTRTAYGQGCMKVSMAADLVEEVVESFAMQRLEDPKVRDRIDTLRAVPKAELTELTGLQARLVELEHQLDAPGVPVAAIVAAIGRTKDRIGHLSELIGRSQVAPLPDKGAAWPEDVPTRRSLVALVVDRVTIQPSTTPGLVDLERIQIEPR